jgi:hypothetical protein
MIPLVVSRPARQAVEPERVTPRIDSTARCGCGADVVFDEVFGWLHAATSQPTPGSLATHVPGPARDAGQAQLS